MGYKYRKGQTPDHVDSSGSNPTNPHLGAVSDSTKKKLTSNQLSDSLYKYEGEARRKASKGDVKGTEAASRKYANFENDYVRNEAESDLKRAKTNLDLVNKMGGHRANQSGKMKEGGGFMYGAESMDTSRVNNYARKKAAENAKKEKLDNIRARAKP